MLAAQLGRTVAETKRSVSSREFSQWQAYWLIRGEPDAWQQASLVAAVAAGAGGVEVPMQQSVWEAEDGSEYRQPRITAFVGGQKPMSVGAFWNMLKAKTAAYNEALRSGD